MCKMCSIAIRSQVSSVCLSSIHDFPAECQCDILHIARIAFLSCELLGNRFRLSQTVAQLDYSSLDAGRKRLVTSFATINSCSAAPA